MERPGGMVRLTDEKINQIQTYHGLAIRRNVGDLDGMTDSVHTILDHTSSFNDKPCHSRCPKGAEIGCG